MNLKERWQAIKGLRTKWMNAPGVQSVRVGYERYGMQSDMEHFESEMERDGNAFEIEEVAWPREGPGAKGDRIGRLRPDFERGRFFLPLIVTHGGFPHYLKIEGGEVKRAKAEKLTSLMVKVARAGEKYLVLNAIRQKNEEGRVYDLTLNFIVEYIAHPALGAHDDLIDAVSRIYYMEVRPPVIINPADLEPETFRD